MLKASNVSNCCVPERREGTCSHKASLHCDLKEVEQNMIKKTFRVR